MESNRISKFLNGKVLFAEKIQEVASLEWDKHPLYEGVYLKHLVKGKDTNNKFSCHLVKIEPGYSLNEHVHEGKWEIHEVIDGDGTANINETSIKYEPGISTIIPEGTKHEVVSGNKNLCILAKFIPALN